MRARRTPFPAGPARDQRRFLLRLLGAGSLAAVLPPRLVAAAGSGTGDAGWRALTAAEWRDRLTDSEYDILREEGTERPFSSPLNDEKRPGTYVCAGCALPLFSSATKFDSGTGWPSFYQPLPDAVGTKRDFRLLLPRTEYHCARCGGHQGHVFDDGPPPTGQRWCNNGLALDFVPASS